MPVFYVTSADGDRRLMSAKGFLYGRPVQKFPWMTDVGDLGHPDNPARSVIGVGGGGYSEQWYVRETVDEIRAAVVSVVDEYLRQLFPDWHGSN